MRLVTCAWVAMLVCAFGSTWGVAKEEDENAAKTPEQIVSESKERSTVAGRFRFDRSCVTDGKPLPKLVGTITQEKGMTYQVMVADESFLKVLGNSDGQNLTLCGTIAKIEKSGAYLLVDSQITPPAPPTTRTKRGGL